MDGDGLNDVMLGSYGADDFAGRAYVVLGSGITSEMNLGIGDADYIFTGEAPDDEAGIINSSAGDIDGDGLDDLVVAAMYNKEVGSGLAPTERSGSGKVYVVTAAELPGTVPSSRSPTPNERGLLRAMAMRSRARPARLATSTATASMTSSWAHSAMTAAVQILKGVRRDRGRYAHAGHEGGR